MKVFYTLFSLLIGVLANFSYASEKNFSFENEIFSIQQAMRQCADEISPLVENMYECEEDDEEWKIEIGKVKARLEEVLDSLQKLSLDPQTYEDFCQTTAGFYLDCVTIVNYADNDKELIIDGLADMSHLIDQALNLVQTAKNYIQESPRSQKESFLKTFSIDEILKRLPDSLLDKVLLANLPEGELLAS